MANTNPSLIHIVAPSGSKIPIFTGKPTDLKPWLAVLKKKLRIYKLTDLELINLANDFQMLLCQNGSETILMITQTFQVKTCSRNLRQNMECL